MKLDIYEKQKGSMLVIALIVTGLFLVLTIGAISYGLLQLKLSRQKVAYSQALQIAEAGVNYYRWVLYHEHEEYCNNETCIGSPNYGPYGPYAYTDSSGKNILGYYQLYITPPAQNGSTIVNIKSIGWLNDYPNIKRVIEVKCGIPAWSSYSTLSGGDIRFGEGTEVWGPIHSNGGIRFDGISHNLITSSLLSYNDPDHSSSKEFGVHTHHDTVDPFPDSNNPPQNVPARNDVFMAGRSFPVPSISFSLLDTYASTTLGLANNGGLVLPSSGTYGYHITLQADDSLVIDKVTNVSGNCSGDPTDRILSFSSYMTTTTPPNGIIFVKDKVWVDGHIDGNRITILAFKEPITGNNTDIVINNDITYTKYDGTDAIGLIAQRNVNVGLYSEDNLQIDAALIAKEGRVGRFAFAWSDSGSCSKDYWNQNTITINGAIATRTRYGFAWTSGSGYTNRNINYDNNLTFTPPPHFPTTGEYTFISWDER